MSTSSPPVPPLAYIEYLTKGLGHRGSTTENEKRAADYVRRMLLNASVHEVEVQRFRSAVKIWRPYIVCLFLGLSAAAVYPLGGVPTRFTAALLCALALWWFYRELNFHDNLLQRLLPKGESQNVIGRIQPTDSVRAQVVLVGHLDSGQTPLLMSSQWTLPLFVLLSFAGVASLAFNAAAYLAGGLTGGPVLYDISWIGTLVLGVTLLFALEAELSPYTQGANDNASAVGVLLGLAQRAADSPLQHTRIWVLLSGCEEVGCYGMRHFLHECAQDVKEACFINLEGVGAGRLHYATREGMLKAYRSDPGLIDVARRVSEGHPDLECQPHALYAGYTETGVVIKGDFRGITVLGLQNNGLYTYLPYWHQRRDTYENLDAGALEQTQEFVWQMLQEIDRRAVR